MSNPTNDAVAERVREVIRKANEHNSRYGITDGNGRQVVPPANTSGITPVGWRILVKPFVVEEKTDTGIVLVKDTVDKEQLAQVDAVVVAMGEDCFSRSDISAPWCKVGDKVTFGKYKGLIRKGKDGVDYRIISDTDIVCLLD